MKERLIWLQEQLQRLQDNYAINSAWQSDFALVKNELADVIANYVEAAAPPPAIVQHVIGEAEMTAIKDFIEAQIAAAAASNTSAAQIIADDIQASDAVVLAAINAKGDDVIAALTPAAEQARVSFKEQ